MFQALRQLPDGPGKRTPGAPAHQVAIRTGRLTAGVVDSSKPGPRRGPSRPCPAGAAGPGPGVNPQHPQPGGSRSPGQGPEVVDLRERGAHRGLLVVDFGRTGRALVGAGQGQRAGAAQARHRAGRPQNALGQLLPDRQALRLTRGRHPGGGPRHGTSRDTHPIALIPLAPFERTLPDALVPYKATPLQIPRRAISAPWADVPSLLGRRRLQETSVSA